MSDATADLEQDFEPVLPYDTDDATAVDWLKDGGGLCRYIEDLSAQGRDPSEIARAVAVVHGVTLRATVIERWLTEGVEVRAAMSRNPLVVRWVQEHAAELGAQVGGDLAAMNDGIAYLHEVTKGLDPVLELCTPGDRVKNRIKAASELGKLIVSKYHLTGEPIIPRTETRPVETLRSIALEVYGSLPGKQRARQHADA